MCLNQIHRKLSLWVTNLRFGPVHIVMKGSVIRRRILFGNVWDLNGLGLGFKASFPASAKHGGYTSFCSLIDFCFKISRDYIVLALTCAITFAPLLKMMILAGATFHFCEAFVAFFGTKCRCTILVRVTFSVFSFFFCLSGYSLLAAIGYTLRKPRHIQGVLVIKNRWRANERTIGTG